MINYHPWQCDEELRALNPLNKVPVLILENGKAVYDSPVICEYLNDYAGGNLIPSAHKYEVLRIQALCDGILDAGVSGRYETHFRPTPMRSNDWLDRQMKAIEAGLVALSHEPLLQETQTSEINLATICVAVTLFYIELRYVELYSSKTPSTLRTWRKQFENHIVFDTTKPQDTLPLPKNLQTIGR